MEAAINACVKICDLHCTPRSATLPRTLQEYGMICAPVKKKEKERLIMRLVRKRRNMKRLHFFSYRVPKFGFERLRVSATLHLNLEPLPLDIWINGFSLSFLTLLSRDDI